jgi:microcystin-dependent protein
MGTPFMGEIKIISWNFAPKGWAFCNGQFQPINQNQALFSLFGTQYGGDGRQTFALPDLRGKVPVHIGAGSFTVQGQVGGQPAHTVNISELPAHMHFAKAAAVTADQNLGGISPDASKAAAQAIVSQQNNQTTPAQMYGTGAPSIAMAGDAISATGGSQPHENMSPYLVLNFIVALQGVFPSQN